MNLYHLGNSHYARQLSGEGARLFGGRWNQKGDACIYTSATRSLCILEYLANVFLEDMPSGLSMTEYSIPDELCTILPFKDLPENWDAIPPLPSAKIFGSNLLADKGCTCFAVPSAVVPAEKNFILNPDSSAFKQVKIVSVDPFILDHRIKQQH